MNFKLPSSRKINPVSFDKRQKEQLDPGGALDFNAFLVGARPGNVPSEDSITEEGKFNLHYFDLGLVEGDTSLTFNGGYAHIQALTPDPSIFSANSSSNTTANSTTTTEHHLCAILHSPLDGANTRCVPAINLLVILDISGSMSDYLTTPKTEEELVSSPNKLDIAKRALHVLFQQLKSNVDAFGLITLNDQAKVIQPLTKVSAIDAAQLDKQLTQLQAGGGTNLMAGLQQASLQFLAFRPQGSNLSIEETRCIFLTDMVDSAETGDDTVGKKIHAQLVADAAL